MVESVAGGRQEHPVAQARIPQGSLGYSFLGVHRASMRAGCSRLTRLSTPIGILFMLTAVLFPLMASARAEASQPLTYAGGASNATYLTAGPTYTLIDTGCCDQSPQAFFDQSGRLVVPYTLLYRPNVAVLDLDPIQLSQGPVRISTSDAERDFAAFDANDRLVAVLSRNAAQPIVYKIVAPDGSTIVNETAVGNLSVGSGGVNGMFYPALAIGKNGAIAIVHSVWRGTTSLVLNMIASNGTPLVIDREIFNDSQWNRFAQITYDPAHDQFVLTWWGDFTGNHALAFDANGSTRWGPLFLGNFGGPINMTVDSVGNAYAIWASGSTVEVTQVSPTGTVLLANQTVIVSAGHVQDPRATAMPGGGLLLVWADNASGSDTDIRAQGVSAGSLQTTTPRISISTPGNGSLMPQAAFRNASTAWVVWADSNSISQDIAVARVDVHHAGFAFGTSAQNLTLWRGELLDVPLNLSSSVDETKDYRLEARFQSFRGSFNWTASFAGASGTNVTVASVAPFATSILTLEFRAPVVSPDGYGAVVIVRAEDLNYPAATVMLALDLTVLAGHAFSVGPAQTNASGDAGSQVALPLDVAITGNLTEPPLPLSLLDSPPPGWVAGLEPPSISGPPGSVWRVNLTVSSPANAASADRYCSRVRVVSANDTYSAASAGFCVFVNLVAVPVVDPPNASASLAPGEAIQISFGVTNAGNAGGPIPCHLALGATLPQGWSAPGLPANLLLGAGEHGSANFSVTAPVDALGLSVVSLNLIASCDGSNVTAAPNLTVHVLVIRSLTWSVPGTGQDANPNATFLINIANAGNVEENVSALIAAAPPGWTVQVVFPGGSADRGTVPPFSSTQAALLIAPTATTPAGSYRVNVSFDGGVGGPYNASFTVGVTRTHGLYPVFALEGDPNTPGGNVTVSLGLAHGGNGPDSYGLTVLVSAPEVWRWSAAYEPSQPGDASSYAAGSLTLVAFSQGTLRIILTAPANPSARSAGITIRLTAGGSTIASFDRTITILEADLAPTIAGDFTGVADPSRQLSVIVTVVNRGEGASGPSHVRVTLDGVAVAFELIGPLAPNASFELTVVCNATAGPHTLEALVDPKDVAGASPLYGEVFESDEANNAVARTFTLDAATPPDGSNGSPPNAPTPGGPPVLVLAVLAGGGAAAVGALFWFRTRRQTK